LLRWQIKYNESGIRELKRRIGGENIDKKEPAAILLLMM
jgi:hypothetical protein